MKRVVWLFVSLVLFAGCARASLGEKAPGTTDAVTDVSTSTASDTDTSTSTASDTDTSTSTAEVTDTSSEEIHAKDAKPEDFLGILDVGARWTTFVALADGTVWSAIGDLGPVLCAEKSDLELMNNGGFVRALNMRPKALSIGQWSGFAIDENDTLWGWGGNLNGSLGAEPTYDGTGFKVPLKIMESVRSVTHLSMFTLAIKTDGSLWIWGTYSYPSGGGRVDSPVKVTDGVESVTPCSSGYVVILKSDGSLWRLETTEAGVFSTVKMLDGVAKLLIGTAITENGALLDFSYVTKAGFYKEVKVDAVQTTLTDDYRLAVDVDGTLWAWDSPFTQKGSGRDMTPRKIASDCRFIVECRQIIYIDTENRLCAALDDGTVKVLDSEVLYAAAGWDGGLMYIKSDGTLWTIQSVYFYNLSETKANGGVHWTETAPKQVMSGVRLP